MSGSSFVVLRTSRLGVEARCLACGAGASVWFNWRYANERRSPEDLDRIGLFSDWRLLRRGKLCSCRICGGLWHLDDSAERMTHVQPEQLPLVLEWSAKAIELPEAISQAVDRIGPTPPDRYGNGLERRVTPCQVRTHSGEYFDKAMICVQHDAPVQDHMRFRLGSDVAEVKDSPFGLPRVVREASARAHEVRMGFYPTLIQMPDGRRFVMNGLTSFMEEEDFTASSARVVEGDYFSQHPLPSFVTPPNDVTYFIFDGDPGWTRTQSAPKRATSSHTSWLNSLLSRVARPK